jgi:hypothetical protein
MSNAVAGFRVQVFGTASPTTIRKVLLMRDIPMNETDVYDISEIRHRLDPVFKKNGV